MSWKVEKCSETRNGNEKFRRIRFSLTVSDPEFRTWTLEHEEFSTTENPTEEREREIKMSFFDFKSKTIWGNTVSFDSLSEKVVMLMNVASQWGRTKKTYEFLRSLSKDRKDVAIVCFPSHEFADEEFEKNKDIARFLDEKFSINQKDTPNLIVLERSNIQKDPVNPIWEFLKKKSQKDSNLKTDWNFSTSFIVSGKKPIVRFDDVAFEKIESTIDFFLCGN